jgi:hypothetical protein
VGRKNIQSSFQFSFLQEIAEPLMDLKNGIKNLKENVTLRRLLEVLLAVGNYLNGVEVNFENHFKSNDLSSFFSILVDGFST